MNFKMGLIILFLGMLLISCVSAREISSRVDDKEIVDTYSTSYTLHTVNYGDIVVDESDYQRVMINDTITFDTKSTFGLYSVLKVNGK